MKGLLILAWLLQRVVSFSTHSTTLFDPLRHATTTSRTSMLDASNNRIFNLNDKGGPFGFQYNAEIWNGRVAQLSFAWVFGQEWVQDKGMLHGLAEQDPASVIALGLFMTLVGFLSLQFVMEPTKEVLRYVEKMKLSHPTGFRNAKSFMEMFDPYRDPDEATVNFNDRGSPFGFKKNAEIWNGRIAMVSFFWVFVQEMLSGRGILDGISKQEGGPLASLVCFLTLMTGFAGMVTDEDNQEKDFVEKVISIEKLQNNVDMDWKPDTMDLYEELPATFLAREDHHYTVSEPPTYEVYMKERERLEALEAARLYEESLREMTRAGMHSSGQQQQPPPSYQVIQASNPSPKWELSFSDSLKAMTSERSLNRVEEKPVPHSPEMPKAFPDEPRRKINEVAAPPMVIAATSQQESNRKRTILVKESLPFASPSLSGAKALDPDYSMRAYDTARYSFELAELWNGRFAQIAFVIVFAQELAQGRGVLQGIEMGDSVSLAGMLTTLLAMIGTGLAFAVNADQRTQTKSSVPLPRKDQRVLRELQAQGSKAALSSVAASVAADADAAREKRPKENPANFKVDGYRFSDLTPQEPKFQPIPSPITSKTHPSQNFKFGQSTQDLIRAEGIPTRAPPLPMVDPISFPSFSNNIDVVAESNGYTINEPLSDGRVGTWLIGDNGSADPRISVPVMAGKGGSNYLESLAPPGEGGNMRP